MTRAISIARRQFLAIAGLTLTAAGFGRLGLLVMADDESVFENTVGRCILALLSDPQSARAVGKAYLQRRPNEADTRMLASSLVGERKLRDMRRLMTDQAALYHAFDAECRRDFEEGELVAIGGWYLARSEARACALAYMLQSDGA